MNPIRKDIADPSNIDSSTHYVGLVESIPKHRSRMECKTIAPLANKNEFKLPYYSYVL